MKVHPHPSAACTCLPSCSQLPRRGLLQLQDAGHPGWDCKTGQASGQACRKVAVRSGYQKEATSLQCKVGSESPLDQDMVVRDSSLERAQSGCGSGRWTSKGSNTEPRRPSSSCAMTPGGLVVWRAQELHPPGFSKLKTWPRSGTFSSSRFSGIIIMWLAIGREGTCDCIT